MSKMSIVNVNVPSDVKENAAKLFNDMGLNMSTAINMFLIKSINSGKIPFEISTASSYEDPKANNLSINEDVPTYNDKELIQALKESEDIINGKIETKWYHNVNDLIKDLESED